MAFTTKVEGKKEKALNKLTGRFVRSSDAHDLRTSNRLLAMTELIKRDGKRVQWTGCNALHNGRSTGRIDYFHLAQLYTAVSKAYDAINLSSD